MVSITDNRDLRRSALDRRRVCRSSANVSVVGHSRRFDRRPMTSGLPPETDIPIPGRHVSKVPILLQKAVEKGREP
jgi:hypothetical protein